MTPEECYAKDLNRVKGGGCQLKEQGKCDMYCLGYRMLDYLHQKSNMPKKYARLVEGYAPMVSKSSIMSLRTYGERFTRLLPDLTQRVEEGKGYFFFSKTTGSGKTTWACALMNHYFIDIAFNTKIEPQGYFMNIPTFLSKVKRSWNSPQSFKEAVAEEEDLIKIVPFLIMDDIGSELITSWSIPYMYEIINQRYEAGLFTLFTSNVPLSIMGKKAGLPLIDSRIDSRITEMTTVVPFDEYDFRKEGA